VLSLSIFVLIPTQTNEQIYWRNLSLTINLELHIFLIFRHDNILSAANQVFSLCSCSSCISSALLFLELISIQQILLLSWVEMHLLFSSIRASGGSSNLVDDAGSHWHLQKLVVISSLLFDFFDLLIVKS